MSDLVIDASLTLQWFFEDKVGREYGLAVLRGLADKRAVVPPLWFYEVGNCLVVAHRRKWITPEQLFGFLIRLKALPIRAGAWLTTYDAAYLEFAMRLRLPLATADRALRAAAESAGVIVI